MLSIFKRLNYCVFSLYILSHSQQNFALQPINDHQLADTVGEKSPIEINTQNLEANQDAETNLKAAKSEETKPMLSPMEQQVLESVTQKVSDPLIIALENSSLNAQFKSEFTIKNLHTTAERNFGLEPFSMMWSGNYQDIVDVDKISFITFNTNTGQYEFDNVRGQVTISAHIHRTNERPVLLSNSTVSLQ